jgi:SAM-dependent methyltransferase
MSKDDLDQIAYWNGRAGESWTMYQDRIDRTLEAITDALLLRAKVGRGERILDVGCGCGATTLRLAEHAGRGGKVIGVDISRPMLSRARSRVVGARGAAIVLMEADAETGALPKVDLVFSRFGTMFFANPVAAFRNLHRSGGRLTMACWRARAENPWARELGDAVASVLGPPEPSPTDAPGPFAFAERTHVVAILGAAGWQEVECEAVDLPLRWVASGELEVVVDFFTHVGPAARRLAEAPPADRERAIAAMRESIRRHMTSDGPSLGGAIWIVTAR